MSVIHAVVAERIGNSFTTGRVYNIITSSPLYRHLRRTRIVTIFCVHKLLQIIPRRVVNGALQRDQSVEFTRPNCSKTFFMPMPHAWHRLYFSLNCGSAVF